MSLILSRRIKCYLSTYVYFMFKNAIFILKLLKLNKQFIAFQLMISDSKSYSNIKIIYLFKLFIYDILLKNSSL